MLTLEEAHQRMLARIDEWDGPEFGTVPDHLGLTQAEFDRWIASRELPEGYAPGWMAVPPTPRPGPVRAPSGRPPIPASVRRRIVEAHRSGLGQAKIAERFGVAKSTVGNIIRRQGS